MQGLSSRVFLVTIQVSSSLAPPPAAMEGRDTGTPRTLPKGLAGPLEPLLYSYLISAACPSSVNPYCSLMVLATVTKVCYHIGHEQIYLLSVRNAGSKRCR